MIGLPATIAARLPKVPDVTALSLFHPAFHVRDFAEARRFCGAALGCTEGRSSTAWDDCIEAMSMNCPPPRLDSSPGRRSCPNRCWSMAGWVMRRKAPLHDPCSRAESVRSDCAGAGHRWEEAMMKLLVRPSGKTGPRGSPGARR
ncbi:MAG: hypothetical protein ACSLE9_12705 [Burkholderiaceae bacterium]